MTIFESVSYKTILKDSLKAKKSRVSSRFSFERMAAAAGVQKTYLSRVLNSDDVHLSEEQVYLATEYLGMPRHEADFVQLLRARERAVTERFKEELDGKIKSIRDKYRQTDEYISVDVKPINGLEANWNQFYLNPLVMLTHIFLTIEPYRQDVAQIAGKLKIDMEQLVGILSELETIGLIKFSGGFYEVSNTKTHLPVGSKLSIPFMTMQRLKAIEKIPTLTSEKTYNFSAVFSANPKVRRKIQNQLLNTIGEIEKLVNGSKEEEVYQLNIDFFDWS